MYFIISLILCTRSLVIIFVEQKNIAITKLELFVTQIK